MHRDPGLLAAPDEQAAGGQRPERLGREVAVNPPSSLICAGKAKRLLSHVRKVPGLVS